VVGVITSVVIYLNDWGVVPKDKLTSVLFTAWDKGEYKDCSGGSTRPSSERLWLVCGDEFVLPRGGSVSTGDAAPKLFKVRYYGLINEEKVPAGFKYDWTCRKNGDEDPAFTCRLQ
jgi:hypothetical protein